MQLRRNINSIKIPTQNTNTKKRKIHKKRDGSGFKTWLVTTIAIPD